MKNHSTNKNSRDFYSFLLASNFLSEDAHKKLFFYSGRTTKRGGGYPDPSDLTTKKMLFLYVSSIIPYLEIIGALSQKVYEIDILFSDTKTTEAASMCHLHNKGVEELELDSMRCLLCYKIKYAAFAAAAK